MYIGEKIARLRKQNDMTQADLGEALNVTYQAVSKWERDESLPDFETISKISKLFQVPISYFEEGGEEQDDEPASETAVTAEILGMCMQCGKVVHDGEAAETTPKLICNACDAENKRIAEEEKKRLAEAKRAKEIHDAKVKEEEKQRAAENRAFQRGEARIRRNRALLLGIIPTAIVFLIFLIAMITDPSADGFLGGFVLTAATYTFTVQMIWGGIVRRVCTGGGFVMNMPGVIFSLSPDGLLFLIFAKIFLGLISGLVFILSILVCAFAAFIIAPFTFVPALLSINRNISHMM